MIRLRGKIRNSNARRSKMISTPQDSHFKGWAKPGPIPPGLTASGPAADHETLDAISGRFRIFQLKDGHRFSTDDILTAWYGTSWCPAARTALDLGSGIGSVGMICAWRLPGARFVTVEAQPESVALAKKSARYNGLEDRYEIRHGDFREAPECGQSCVQAPAASEQLADEAVRAPGKSVLRADEKFDLITGSPPYWPLDAGLQSEHPQKVACRFEVRGSIADYCLAAAKHLAPGGFFACVFQIEPAAQLARVHEAAKAAGLSIVRQRPVIFREGEPPLIGLFGMTRAEDLPDWFRGQTWTEPPLTIRTREGKIHPEYSAVKLSFGFAP